MANPRRAAFAGHYASFPAASSLDPSPSPSVSPSLFSSLLIFLKRPASFPLLLSLFLLLTWVSLRFQYPSGSPSSAAIGGGNGRGDGGVDKAAVVLEANMVKYSAIAFPSPIAADGRGWLLDPVATARSAGLHGGTLVCSSLHVGQIQPGGLRGNHRHHTCNETLVIWGATTKFRLENVEMVKGYTEVLITDDDVAVIASPRATAHAMINLDTKPTYIIGCQDTLVNPNSSNTDYHVWSDI